MRAHFVELFAEGVELSPLAPQISPWRAGRLRFHSAVHAFVAGILLWFARLDPMMSDTQLDPPHT